LFPVGKGQAAAGFNVVFAGAVGADGAAFLAAPFLALGRFAAAFLAGAFLAGAFFAATFLAGAFLAAAFLAGAFLAGAFLAGAFLAGAFFAAVFLAGRLLGRSLLRSCHDDLLDQVAKNPASLDAARGFTVRAPAAGHGPRGARLGAVNGDTNPAGWPCGLLLCGMPGFAILDFA